MQSSNLRKGTAAEAKKLTGDGAGAVNLCGEEPAGTGASAPVDAARPGLKLRDAFEDPPKLTKVGRIDIIHEYFQALQRR
jgi:hypothetical protein